MATVQDILRAKPTEVSRPKPLPTGTYHTMVKGHPEQGESSQKKTPFVRFMLQPMAIGDDVDEEALKVSLTKADGSSAGLQDRTIRATYYLTPDAIWRLEQFLEHLGFALDGKASLEQMIAESNGRQCLATLKHTMNDDGAIFAELASTAAVPA